MARKPKPKKNHLDTMTEAEKSAAWQRWVDRHVAFKDKSGSPIETKFGHALATIWEEEIGGPMHLTFGVLPDPAPEGLTIVQQCEFGKYRLDFLLGVKCPDGTAALLAVECGGFDYHDRTKEQAARDKARDRYVALAGVRTIRFAGTEIHKDVFKCAREALVHIGFMQYGVNDGTD